MYSTIDKTDNKLVMTIYIYYKLVIHTTSVSLTIYNNF